MRPQIPDLERQLRTTHDAAVGEVDRRVAVTNRRKGSRLGRQAKSEPDENSDEFEREE
jgi:hypothetical protein